MQELEDSGLTRDEILYNRQVRLEILSNVIDIDWNSSTWWSILLICEKKQSCKRNANSSQWNLFCRKGNWKSIEIRCGTRPNIGNEQVKLQIWGS